MDRRSIPESGGEAASLGARTIQLAELCEQLASTSRKLEKRSLIAQYLRSLDLEDAQRAALYLAGMPFSETDIRQLNVGGALLSRVVAELTRANPAAMHAAYLRHGDLGGAALDLLNGTTERRHVPPTLTLGDLESEFASTAAASKPLIKQRLVFSMLERAAPLEAKYLIKIVLGDMRTGVQVSLVEEAVAAAFDTTVAQVRRAMMLTGSLPEVVALAANHGLDEARMKLFHPLGFMLASPVDTVEEALQRFSQEIGLAALLEAQLEDKYDGVRAQIHCGDPEQPGRVTLFSRSRDDMTASFPEIVQAFSGFPVSLILDGEILAWDPGGVEQPEVNPGRALAFTSLQPRLGRKRVTTAMREATPVIFMAFDMLYFAGELMLEWPLSRRRQALEELVAREQRRTRVFSDAFSARQSSLQFDQPSEDSFPRLLLAPAVQLESVAQLEQAYFDARERGNEGVMLKDRRSKYQPGRRGLEWLKLKRELATLDVVVTAAEYGHGKRAGLLSDYTFAVRDGNKLRNVGKAYSGVTDAEIATLTEFFMGHTVEDFGSVRSVEPRIVLEVAFNNVMRSTRHDSGFALRFPRIVRIRDDKPVGEIDTLERVAEIYRSQEHSPPSKTPRGGDLPD